jgi:hypothetical protein
MDIRFPLAPDTELTKETLIKAFDLLVEQKFPALNDARAWVVDNHMAKWPMYSNNKQAIVACLNAISEMDDVNATTATPTKAASTPRITVGFETIANEVGIRDAEILRESPSEVRKEGTTSIMELGERRTVERVAQPLLTQKEVERLGICEWHRLKQDKTLFTTVVNGRRFLLSQSDFAQLKDRGLVVQVG